MHPSNPEQPVGVLQCFNKRARDGVFSDADLLTAKLLCIYAATAAMNAARFDSDYRCRVLSRRAVELSKDIAVERDISELSSMITARAKELSGSHRARLYFIHSPVATGSSTGVVNLQPVPDLVCF